MDRLNSRLAKTGAVSLILVLLGAACAGIFIWARRNNIDNLIRTCFLIKTQSLKKVSTPDLVEGAIRGMVDSLNDPYSVYLDRNTYRELNLQIEGSFGGIGVEIDLDSQKQLVVVAPLPGTPASRAGLRSGDVITEINGKKTTGMSVEQAARVLRGSPGSSVGLKIWRPRDNRRFSVSLRREIISVPSARGEMLAGHPGIGYLQVMHFNQNSTIPQMTRVLRKLEQAGYRGLILDLRGNPGGDLQTAVELASYFVKKGPVVRIVHRGGVEDVWQTSRYIKPIKVPLVVLVDGGSASASEIVAGAIKDSGSGVLVGTRTFGKGLVQTVFNLDRQVGVKLTTDKYLTPNGHDINQKGIIPDVVVQQPQGSSQDLQLQKALEILEEKLGKAAEKAA